MGDIEGAQAVIDGKATTASGIKAIGNYKLRITLTKVAPDFLARITMPFFSAVKTDTPINKDGVSAPSKGTACGPYYVSEWVTKRTATLSRNPFYKGGRPANPDQIQYTIGTTTAAQELRVNNAETDLGGFPTSDAADLYNQYYVALGKKLNTGSKPSFVLRHQATFWYLNMNQDQPLFKNNSKLAQAVNWAIDRPQMVRQHGAKAGVVTSQILPYGFPGHNAKAAYPVVASKSPNFNKGKALANGNTRGGNCRFWTFNTTFGPTVAQVVQYDLKQIGLNCEITPLDRVVETTKGGNRSTNDYDLLLNGWGQDYPDPYDFINILLDGKWHQAGQQREPVVLQPAGVEQEDGPRPRSSPVRPGTRRTPSSTMTSWPARRRLLRTSTRTRASSCPSVWVATCTRRRTAPSSTPPASASGRETHYRRDGAPSGAPSRKYCSAAIEFLPRTNR